MIVSEGRNFIFVHIPKTGGTSLAAALEDRAMKEDILIGDTPKAKKRRRRIKDVQAAGRLWKHSMLSDLPGLVPAKRLERFFVFTLVRNPFDRMVSYYHWLKTQQFNHAAVRRAQTMSFEAFVCHPMTMRSLSNAPYARYVTLPNGVEHCNAYIRLEHLEQDLAPVRAHLGLPLDTIPQLNRSVRPVRFADIYTSAAKTAVSQSCADDLARFGYSFDD